MTDRPTARPELPVPLDLTGPGRAADARTTSAIDALRAATTAAGSQPGFPSPDAVSQIGRLHEMTVAAERHSRRMLGTPGARRKLQQARAAEAAALEMHGFSSYEGFAAIYEPPRNADETASESEATVARIRELLHELGVDPLDDPLEAASAFLTTHEPAAPEAASAPVVPVRTAPEPPVVAAPVAEPVAEHVVEHLDITSVMASFASPPVPAAVPEPEAPAAAIPAPVVPVAPDVAVAPAALEPPAPPEAPPVSQPMTLGPPADEIHLHDPGPPVVETPAPAPEQWAEPPVPHPADDEAVDRWIHAEARAERLHAEVDRAQAELMAMLARSADLEESVVTRDDELDAATAELERVRQRVAELESSIARSGAEREDLERVLSSARDRVVELEAAVLERERASVQATNERTAALQAVVELETTLTQRTAELEAVRAAVTEMEAELAAARGTAAALESELAARNTVIEKTGGDLTTARADNDALAVELETTKRALEALDAHAEAIEAALAEARREAESPESLREAEMLRAQVAIAQQELDTARERLRSLEAEHEAAGNDLTRVHAELEELQHALQTARDEMVAAREETLVAVDETEAAQALAEVARDELLAARRAVDDARAEVDVAARAREAITIDTADLLARAEAQAASLLERANRDAEAIRQEALRWEEGLREEGRREQGRTNAGGDDADIHHYEGHKFGAETPAELLDRIERLERKVAKQRRRLDRMAGAPTAGDAEREAEEIRRAARRDREQFRAELEGLLRRLAPMVDDTDDDEDDEFA